MSSPQKDERERNCASFQQGGSHVWVKHGEDVMYCMDCKLIERMPWWSRLLSAIRRRVT